LANGAQAAVVRAHKVRELEEQVAKLAAFMGRLPAKTSSGGDGTDSDVYTDADGIDSETESDTDSYSDGEEIGAGETPQTWMLGAVQRGITVIPTHIFDWWRERVNHLIAVFPLCCCIFKGRLVAVAMGSCALLGCFLCAA
jgi:hypothetical protein